MVEQGKQCLLLHRKAKLSPCNMQQLSSQIMMATTKVNSPMVATSMLSNKAITGAQHHPITPNDPRFEPRNSTALHAMYKTLVATAFSILHTSHHDIVPVPPFKMPRQGWIKPHHRLRPPHKPRCHYPPALLRHKQKLNEVCTSMIVHGIIEHSACCTQQTSVEMSSTQHLVSTNSKEKDCRGLKCATRWCCCQ